MGILSYSTPYPPLRSPPSLLLTALQYTVHGSSSNPPTPLILPIQQASQRVRVRVQTDPCPSCGLQVLLLPPRSPVTSPASPFSSALILWDCFPSRLIVLLASPSKRSFIVLQFRSRQHRLASNTNAAQASSSSIDDCSITSSKTRRLQIPPSSWPFPNSPALGHVGPRSPVKSPCAPCDYPLRRLRWTETKTSSAETSVRS